MLERQSVKLNAMTDFYVGNKTREPDMDGLLSWCSDLHEHFMI